ncbi:MAG TPA: hypothetical protein PKY70_12180 [Nakamurella multipartita]|nr:hypothetical protein [Nakamurella multipartita]
MSERMDHEGLRELRTELLADLSGTVVEVGAGNGRNFACARASSPGSTRSKPKPRSARAAEAVTAALLNDLDIPAAAIARQEGGYAARGLVSLLALS